MLAGLTTVVPFTILLAPLLALPAAAVLRLAMVALADGVPSWRVALAELRRAPGRKLAIAAIQLALTGIGIVNLIASGSIPGIAGALSTVVVAYGLLIVWWLATAVWPILADPRREMGIGRLLQLGLAVALSRPLGMLAVLAIVVGSAIVSVQYIFPAIVLPSLVLLVVAGYVGPIVERLDPVEPAWAEEEGEAA